PESMRLRFHCQTAAATLTRAQPMNNVVRTALQALSAVLGGAQSLHTNGLDEAYAIPSEEAMKLALRTQQIIAEESRVASVIEPAGPVPVPIHKVDAAVETRQVVRLQEVRRRRDGARVQALLDQLAAEAGNSGGNLMPLTIEAVKARATLGEIIARLRAVFGAYVEKPVF